MITKELLKYVMNKKIWIFITTLILFFGFQPLSAQNRPSMPISNLKYFRHAYPDFVFSQKFDREKKDWIVYVTVPPLNKDSQKVQTFEFYWSNGSMLPESELKNADKYWPLLYNYQKELRDPADFTEEEKQRILNFSSTDNRKNGAGTPMFFFDAIYDSSTRRKLEQHIVKISFLGNSTNVHELIKEPLKRVEERIYALAEKETAGTMNSGMQEINDFLKNIKSNDAYYWRIIEGTNRKSFHSLGIAVDVLPKKRGDKQIFWSWAKDKYPDTWMLVPLKDRWMPPQAVIRIFEEEGFIWGGKWTIYDNMHFEYHPELIQYNFYR